MSRPPLKIDAQLEAGLRRIADALGHNRDQGPPAAAAREPVASDATAARAAAQAGKVAARIAERHERRMEKLRRRGERRRERQRLDAEPDETDLPKGIVFAIVAVTCLVFAVIRPVFFWMLFVALGFGMTAAQSFGRAIRRWRLEEDRQAGREAEAVPETEQRQAPADRTRTAEATPPPPPPVAHPPDPKVVRIQSLCDKLLSELESGPPIVREVVTEPRATIAGLRQACLETARRERELRSVLAAQDESVLVAERDGLAARLSNEQDAIVRDRLGQALAALEQQLVHRAALATAATRLEAENTRILYTLENVHMQLLRARSTDMGAPELGGKLRDSLRELGTQIEAVAEALELVDAPVGSQGATDDDRRPDPRPVPETSA